MSRSLRTAAVTFCFAVLGGLGMLCGNASAATQNGWDIVKIGDRDYVTTDNIKTFYKFDTSKREGETLTLENARTRMKLRVGGMECLMNNVKFVFSYPVATSGNKVLVSRIDLAKLIDPVLRPSYIKNAGDFRTVILDPGHGGKDAGATNPFGTEANYTLQVAKKVKKVLESPEFVERYKTRFNVVLTRDTDRFISLQERVQFANAVKENAVYVSIHFNSGNPSARGIETFSLSPQGVAHYGRDIKSSDFSTFNGNEHDSANIALATAVHGSVLQILNEATKNKTFDRGIKRARWSVLTGVHHPAILLECGFVTNPYEARLIQDDGYSNTVAKGIADALIRYRYAVGRKPNP